MQGLYTIVHSTIQGLVPSIFFEYSVTDQVEISIYNIEMNWDDQTLRVP